MTVLLINEVFSSFQGEGPSLGQAAVFLRLANCNLACSWCDTRYSWDWSQFDPANERHEVYVPDLARQLISNLHPARLLIITGGEPLLQQPALRQLVVLLRDQMPGLRVEIETNGTVTPTPSFAELVNLFVVSPKLSNSAQPEKRRLRPRALASFPWDRAILKFVVTELGDLGEIAQIRVVAGVPPNRTWIMPEGTESDAIVQGLRSLSAPVAELGYNLSPRLQILLWGSTRGV